MMMINITNFDTSIRGGPGSFEDQMAGGETGQFDTLLGALTFMPVALSADGDAPVPYDGGPKQFPFESGSSVSSTGDDAFLETDSHPTLLTTEPTPESDPPIAELTKELTLESDSPGPIRIEPTALEPVTALPETAPAELTGETKIPTDFAPVDPEALPQEPEVLWEGFERKSETKPKQAEPAPQVPVPTQQNPQRTWRVAPLANRSMQMARGHQLMTPTLRRQDIPPPEIPVDAKKQIPVVETPPIIILPKQHRLIGPPIWVDSKDFGTPVSTDTVPPQPAVAPNGNTNGPGLAGGFYSSHSDSPAQEFISPEDKLLLSDRKWPDKDGFFENRAEAGKITEAIFQKFAISADKAIRQTNIDVRTDAEPLVEQIGKPILEVTEALLEDGEPVILKFRLKPAELGSVEIRLERNAAGKLNIAFHTETDSAHRVLHESFSQLREALKDSGWQINDLNVTSRASVENSLNQHHNGNGKFQDQNSVPNPKTDDPNGESITEPALESDSPDRLVSLMA